MKLKRILKRILKWTAYAILLALIVGIILLCVGYWRSTNDCDRNTAAPINPMKAIRYCEYGSPDVVKLVHVEKPVPADNQVLIKVRAASLNAFDMYAIRDAWLNRLIFGLRKPRDTRLGRDVAGMVETVGKNVTQFKPGDEVFGISRGALAEYACPRRTHGAAGPARREDSARPEGVDQRRDRRCRDVRRANRQIF
jgi:Alcohol dehydrogenase GroES-like domain